jgi:hypothetical protein
MKWVLLTYLMNIMEAFDYSVFNSKPQYRRLLPNLNKYMGWTNSETFKIGSKHFYLSKETYLKMA